MGVLALCLFPISVYASPIPDHALSSSSAACLAVIITIFILITILVIVKHFYMKRRCMESSHSRLQSSSNAPRSFSMDSYFRSSASVSFSPNKKDCFNNDKAGILVGFLGSPAWETRVVLDKAGQKQRQESSFMYHLHTQSRRRYSDIQRTSIRGVSSYMPSLSGSVSVASVVDSRALYDIRDATNKRRSRLVWLPAQSNNVYSGPTDVSIGRRLSLPAAERTMLLTDAPDRKRHSSLKSAKGIARQLHQTSQACGILFPGSVRLVKSDTPPEIVTRHDPPPSPSSPSPKYTSQAKFSNILGRKARPLPPFPVSQRSPLASPEIRSPAAVYISHPYALVPHNLPNKPHIEVTRDTLDELENCPVPRPLSLGEDGDTITSQTQCPRPLSILMPTPRNMPPINFSPLECALPSMNLSPPPAFVSSLPDSPMKPLTHIQPLPMMPKLKFSKSRSRKSPPVGPSPLRTMILPDASSGSVVGSPDEMEDTKNSLDSHGVQPLNIPSPQLFLGFRHSGANDDKGSFTTTKKDEDEATDALLGIIRELVEETSDWDEDLFMNDNFKSLIRNAGGEVVESSGSSGSASRSGSSDSTGTFAADVDLGLLGLDRFKEEYSSSKDYELEGAKEDSAMDLVSSFWADTANDGEDGKQRDGVGMAW